MYITHFSVRGELYFPLDMLRYDSCYPASQDAVGTIAESLGRCTKKTHTVELVTRHPNKESPVTQGRWESFGWTVVTVSTRRL